MKQEEKEKIALWRLGVLGPLISARLEHGDRRHYFEETAKRELQQPDGSYVMLSARTIESWYYDHLHGGFDALVPNDRADLGSSRVIPAEIADLILRAKQERPRRTIKRIIDMIERAKRLPRGTLRRSTVHHLLQAHQLSTRPLRAGEVERRSFLPEHAGDLWVGDALHGPRVIAPDGSLCKSYLLSQLDGATRFITHSYFALSEDAVDHEYGLRQAILKHGLPRTYYVDLGSAYISHSLKLICAELGIHLLHTKVRDCQAKGAIERWHKSWREEIGDELPDYPLPLAELNAIHWAWLGAEYTARKHSTTGRVPREHWLEELSFLRSVPRNKNLAEVFLHREKRTVRKDGTVRWKGDYLEVKQGLEEQEVELRFDPRDATMRPRVFIDNAFVCDTVPLDRMANASRRRRRLHPPAAPEVKPTGLDPLALIKAEHYDRIRPVDQPQDQKKTSTNKE